ncbi:DUF5118 domain-containing protein [Chitinophaga sedimenti]|nr:DUF5118 domain-containing protein [Chitinophaga sedimenti]MCK7553722.1 DUF5118 domain-containing protein [Chitinophaga sedimenti]
MLTRKLPLFALIFSCAIVGVNHAASAQKRKKKKGAATVVTPPAKPVSDSSRKTPPKVKKYSEVITKDMESSKGFLTVHKKRKNFILKYPSACLNAISWR